MLYIWKALFTQPLRSGQTKQSYQIWLGSMYWMDLFSASLDCRLHRLKIKLAQERSCKNLDCMCTPRLYSEIRLSGIIKLTWVSNQIVVHALSRLLCDHCPDNVQTLVSDQSFVQQQPRLSSDYNTLQTLLIWEAIFHPLYLKLK